MSHQRNQGDDDFDYLRQSDSIFLDNSIQYSDFNSPKERSWMLRYDLDLASYGVPGLSFMTRYGRGSNIDYSDANSVYMRRDADGNPLTEQKRWERDIEARYVVQSGSLKDLSLRLRQATRGPRPSSRTWTRCAWSSSTRCLCCRAFLATL